MLLRELGALAGILLIALISYVKYSRSRRVLSTTEWVRLMRENEARMDALRKREASKGLAVKAKA